MPLNTLRFVSTLPSGESSLNFALCCSRPRWLNSSWLTFTKQYIELTRGEEVLWENWKILCMQLFKPLRKTDLPRNVWIFVRFNAHFDKLCKNRREEAYFRPLFLLLLAVKDAHLKRTFEAVSFSAHARKSRTTQRHPTTVFFKISVRRSKYCLEFPITWRRLKISRWPFHSCKTFEVYLINSLRFYEA